MYDEEAQIKKNQEYRAMIDKIRKDRIGTGKTIDYKGHVLDARYDDASDLTGTIDGNIEIDIDDVDQRIIQPEDVIKLLKEVVNKYPNIHNNKIRPNTKWFSFERAKNCQRVLLERGIQTHLVRTTKLNKLSGHRKPAYLVEKTPYQINKEKGRLR